MIRETRRALLDILKTNKDPDVAHVLRFLLSYEGDLSEIDQKALFVDKPKSSRPETTQDITLQDLRIKWLTFRNFRSVPYSESVGKEYGISFCDTNETPCSVFLVGRNGTGKTTLYSALERHYISQSSISREKNLEEARVLTYGFNQLDDTRKETPKLGVCTMTSKYDDEGFDNHQPLCSPAPFCSEYDLQQLGSEGENLFEYMLTQLGYQELTDVRDVLLAMKLDREERLAFSYADHPDALSSSDLKEILCEFISRYGSVKSFFSSLSSDTMYDKGQEVFSKGKIPKIFSDYWKKLKGIRQDAEKAKDPIEDYSLKASASGKEMEDKLKKLYSRLENDLRACADNDSHQFLLDKVRTLQIDIAKKESEENKSLSDAVEREKLTLEHVILQKTIEAIDGQRSQVVVRFVDKHYTMLKEILSYFSDNDGELLKPAVRGNSLKIEIKAKSFSGKEFVATPQEYYNSFRFKLYAVSFKIALAFMEMSMKNIRVPIVIDDVFSASDFENNLRLEYFVASIYKAYDQLEFTQPLQLILLTHDEMVQTAFQKGIQAQRTDEKEKSLSKPLKRPFIAARLFSYRVAESLNANIYGKEALKDLPFYNLYMPLK